MTGTPAQETSSTPLQPRELPIAANLELTMGVGAWMTCSIGMMVSNKLAISYFPLECFLVVVQMAVTVVCMCGTSFWSPLHFGSLKDVLRWCMVVPFFTGMLLTSILALKHAPMSLVITFRVLSPLVALGAEHFFPNPLRVTGMMIASILVMLVGVGLYAQDTPKADYAGAGWVLLNAFFAVGDRLLQRYMLARDQNPVDISKTGVTLLNNAFGMVPMIPAIFYVGEHREIMVALENLSGPAIFWVLASCVVGVGISYTGIWAQSMITATSFLVLVNVNKFAIIFLEVFVMKNKNLTNLQILGASIAVIGGILFGKARELVEMDEARCLKKESKV